jgi:hypothetical protein
VLGEMIYNLQEGSWKAGKLQEQELKVHQQSNLVTAHPFALYYQDPSGKIQRVEVDLDGDWREPVRIDNSNPSATAKVGSQLFGVGKAEIQDQGRILWYESSSNGCLSVVDEPGGKVREGGILRMPNIAPATLTLQPGPDQSGLQLDDFVFAHDNNKDLLIVFRTADNYLNLARRSVDNNEISQIYSRMCETMPGSRFLCETLCFNGNDWSTILFFISPNAKLKMMELALNQLPDAFRFPYRTVFFKSCKQGMWRELIQYQARWRCPSDRCNMRDDSSSE